MKSFFILILFFCCLDVFSQEIQSDTRNRTANRTTNTNASISQIRGIYDYDFVERKPIFFAGRDSLNKIYLSSARMICAATSLALCPVVNIFFKVV